MTVRQPLLCPKQNKNALAYASATGRVEVNKEILKLMRRAKKQGWSVQVTKKNHIKFFSPLGGIVVASGTPSESRGFLNLKARLKSKGLVD
jgi:hypothetical protein